VSSRDTAGAGDQSESSVDSAYDHLSIWDSYRYELRDRDIRNSLQSVGQGSVQVTLRKCSYTIGFEIVPRDLSRESLCDSVQDEGYSNKYGNNDHQEGAWEDIEQTDEVPENGLRRAVGIVSGTESSARIEQLMGTTNEPHIEDTIRCDPGASSVSVRFLVEEQESSSDTSSEQ